MDKNTIETTLFTAFAEVRSREDLSHLIPSVLSSATSGTYSMVVRFDSADLKEFEPSDIDLNKLEEAWFFSSSECLHIRRASPGIWLALRMSETGFDGATEHSGVRKMVRPHILAGESIPGQPGVYYAEMLPSKRHYPIQGTPFRVAIECAHHTFEDQPTADGLTSTRSVFRPMALSEFRQEAHNG